jgi:hypothetical protein
MSEDQLNLEQIKNELRIPTWDHPSWQRLHNRIYVNRSEVESRVRELESYIEQLVNENNLLKQKLFTANSDIAALEFQLRGR